MTLMVESVRKTFGDVVALDGVDLSIRPGQICALLGRNGAGKTTLVSVVAGLLRPDEGRVEVAGVDVRRRPRAARRHLGLAPQQLGIYPVLTVRENLRFMGELVELSRQDVERRIGELADELELGPMIDRPARDLSGGQQRRLHTALALLHRPELLLLDEPTVGVDIESRQRLLASVRRLASEHGCAICYSTHYLPEVDDLGADVVVIDDGRILARGSVDALVRDYGEPAIELRFGGPAPAALLADGHAPIDDGVRIPCTDPESRIGDVLLQVEPYRSSLRSIEIVRPSLEAVVLALTGTRLTSSAATSEGSNP